MSASSDRADQGVIDFCQQVADGLDAAGNCPCCAAALQVTVSIYGVGVTCPSGCFRFDYRCNLHGGFVSGLLDFPRKETGSTVRALSESAAP